MLSSPLSKAVWVFTILWQENTALHFKHIKASSVTATKSLSSSHRGLSRNGSICPWEDHRSNKAQSQFHITSIWVPPFKSPKQAGCQGRQRGERTWRCIWNFMLTKVFPILNALTGIGSGKRKAWVLTECISLSVGFNVLQKAWKL